MRKTIKSLFIPRSCVAGRPSAPTHDAHPAFARARRFRHMPADSGTALLLAGQIRTFEEQPVRRALMRSVVAPTGAAIFAHLSPEYSSAVWHHQTSEGERPHQTVTLEALERLIRNELEPRHLTIQTDEELKTQQAHWAGHVRGDSRQYSSLLLRWLLLLKSLEQAEAEAGRRFALILRMRPDVVLECVLQPALPSIRQLSTYDVVVSRDFLALMDRRAAGVALTAYVLANHSRDCRLKAELCVPSLLIERNLSVGVLADGVSIVRPPTVRSAACSSPVAPSSFDCGRALLAAERVGRTACAIGSARPWNMTARRHKWLRAVSSNASVRSSGISSTTHAKGYRKR